MFLFGKKLKVKACIHTNEFYLRNYFKTFFGKLIFSKSPVVLFVHFSDTMSSLTKFIEEINGEFTILEDKSQLQSGRLKSLLNQTSIVIIPPFLIKFAKDSYQVDKLEMKNIQFVVVETYPAYGPDQQIEEFCKSISVKGDLTFHTHLETLLMRVYDSGKVKNLLINFGYSDGEVLDSKMLYNALIKAQKKISKEFPGDKTAESELEWFKLNTNIEIEED